MSNLSNKAYFVASSLAALTLLASLALAVSPSVPIPLILTLSVLVLALVYKIISDNKRMEVEKK